MAAQQLDPATIDCLDGFTRDVFGCPVEQARVGGVHLRAVRERALPSWRGYIMPVIAVAFDTGAAIAVRPDLVDRLAESMGGDVRRTTLDSASLRRLWRATERLVPHAFALLGDFRAVNTNQFQPRVSRSSVELMDLDDPAALDIRRRFDGPVFGIRGPRGRLLSWAALKLKSDAVWEVAVATDADYRGRGYGRDVVSVATAHCLEQGRICAYIHAHDNSSSGFIARALGYRRYAEVVLAEF